jgi:two-component system NtrC family response regulator
MATILIIDDEKIMSNMIKDMVTQMGHEAFAAYTLQEGVAEASSKPFDVVFLDVRLPDGNGLDALPQIQTTPSTPEVVIITGYGDPDGAELAMKNGAWDYLEKTSSLKTIKLCLERAIQYREVKKEKRTPLVFNREQIIGGSPKMLLCLDLLAQAAVTDADVLIFGETGTGKELFAQAIHKNSKRSQGNFIIVDCAALPPTIVESILFGHEKGAFTGADKTREGLIGQADGGTLFLDEVGELPLVVQKAFLRVLQERSYRPVGGKVEHKSNFRLVSATNRNLDAMVKTAQFRDDFLFRLKTITIDLPPLREHNEDIGELVFYYLGKLCERYDMKPKSLSSEFLDSLMAYSWPGNVRELVHTLERVLAVTRDETILYPQHLPTDIRVKLARASLTRKKPSTSLGFTFDVASGYPKFADYRKTVDEEYLRGLMSLTGSNIKEACTISGLSRSHLYALLKDHGLQQPE